MRNDPSGRYIGMIDSKSCVLAFPRSGETMAILEDGSIARCETIFGGYGLLSLDGEYADLMKVVIMALRNCPPARELSAVLDAQMMKMGIEPPSLLADDIISSAEEKGVCCWYEALLQTLDLEEMELEVEPGKDIQPEEPKLKQEAKILQFPQRKERK